MRHTRSIGAACVLGASLAVMLGVMSACNVLGPALIIAKGPPTTEALHTLERDRMTLFFVDDRSSRLPRQTLRITIAEAAGNTLLEKKALTKVRDPSVGPMVVAGERRGDLMDAATIGRNAEAEVIVLVSVKEFTISPDRQSIQPFARVLVRVVDCVNPDGVRWPEEPAGHELVVTMTPPSNPPRTVSEIVRLEEDFAKRVGQKIAFLFTKHETERGIGAK